MTTSGAPLVVLNEKRGETVRRIVGSIAFIAVGVFMAVHPLTGSFPFGGFPGADDVVRLVGAMAVLVFGRNVVRQSRWLRRPLGRLELSEQGFRVVGGRSERFVRWADCSPFRNSTLLPNVVFTEATPTDSRLAGPDDAATHGRTSMMLSTYGLPWSDLAALLNRCRDNALRGDPILSTQVPAATGTPAGPDRGRGRHR